MATLKGIGYLRNKLALKRTRVELRYQFYEMKNFVRDFGISSPDWLTNYSSVVGWCAKAVDSLSDRVVFRKFEDDNFYMNEIFNLNNPDMLFDSAIKSALISSCSFVYISKDESGYPRLQVIDGGNATGIIDPITGLLQEGYAVLERDEFGAPKIEAYFEPFKTTVFYIGQNQNDVYDHNVAYPLLVPIINNPDAKRPFGHSLISRACMSIVESACRTIKRSEISAEFYSFPQKYIIGTDPDAERLEKWRVSISSLLEIT